MFLIWGLLRLVMVVVWALTFAMLSYLAVEYGYIRPQMQVEQPGNPEAVRQAMRPYALPLFGAALLLAGTLAGIGVLPGARGRRAAPATADAPSPAAVLAAQSPGAPCRAVEHLDRGAPPAGATPTTHRHSLVGAAGKYAPHLVIGGVFLLIGMLLTSMGLSRPDSGAMLPGTIMLGISVAAVLIVLLLPAAVKEVHLSGDELTWIDDHGAHRRAWADVVDVHRTEQIINNTFRKRKVDLSFVGGAQVTFDQCLSDFDGLVAGIEAATTAQFLPLKRADLARYGAQFGPVTLRKDGIQVAQEFLAWDRVEHWVLFNGTMLFFPQRQGCVPIALSEVPNYPTLLRLLAEEGHAPAAPGNSRRFAHR